MHEGEGGGDRGFVTRKRDNKFCGREEGGTIVVVFEQFLVR